ncbi:porin [Xanthobacter dioxanivorans]|uniref:Porin n=2 Tax=Xanthobacter dioxanivorans TaxID=2528964 RepID=A0A974PUL9_9HYPH|nr:porin [Xanthobacter dioxanivorans]
MNGMRISMSAALGLLVLEGASAADLPEKAKAVEYMKVCTAYGAGYYYIPGTDTCIKIGGFARLDAYVNAVGTFTPMITSSADKGFNGPGAGGFGYPFRDDDDPAYFTRVRGVMNMDARTQTEFGTLRSYVRFGANWDTQGTAGTGAGSGLYFERAFIQFAGFTFGYTQSFFDPGLSYIFTAPLATSNDWTTVAAYTVQIGNGFSASLSLEDAANRTTGVQMTGATATPIFNINTVTTGLGYTNFQAGQVAPDVVANLRVDQAWGSAQLSGAVHQVTATAPLYTGFFGGLETSNAWGWALGAHVEVKLPMLAAGDSFFVQAAYAEGAANYIGLSASQQARGTGIGSIELTQQGGTLSGTGAYYTIADAVATSTTGDFGLMSGWAIQGQFRHFWTPGLRSALYAGYASYDVPQNIVAAFAFDTWQIGLNTIWSPVKDLDIGVEVLYSKVDGSVPLGNYAAISNTGATINSIAGGSADVWSGGMRVQRNF